MIYLSTNMQEFNPQITLDTAILSKEITVSNQEEHSYWGDVLKLCKNKIKEVEEQRKEFTKPLDEAKKVAMSKEKEITEPINEFIEKINKAMNSWFIEENRKRQEEQKRLEEEAIANANPEDCDVVVPVVEEIKTTKGSIATTTMIKDFKFEIIDESLIPREYLIPDEAKIKKAINSGVEIPGIKSIENYRTNSR